MSLCDFKNDLGSNRELQTPTSRLCLTRFEPSVDETHVEEIEEAERKRNTNVTSGRLGEAGVRPLSVGARESETRTRGSWRGETDKEKPPVSVRSRREEGEAAPRTGQESAQVSPPRIGLSGIPLQALPLSESDEAVPQPLVEICQFLSQHPHTEGLFRKSGSATRIRALKQQQEETFSSGRTERDGASDRDGADALTRAPRTRGIRCHCGHCCCREGYCEKQGERSCVSHSSEESAPVPHGSGPARTGRAIGSRKRNLVSATTATINTDETGYKGQAIGRGLRTSEYEGAKRQGER
ncbi:hypothetical protein NDU88_004341 [Pleurodeles waltl]|uniref:Uncharacterized protein n=1 Tax=Pleurodeles waltl TaxID=8319 RepID=A0AAV7WRK8_PLEWA|nr:hypothetical protein NDU88_004341 [Pleurodeles waltl]